VDGIFLFAMHSFLAHPFTRRRPHNIQFCDIRASAPTASHRVPLTHWSVPTRLTSSGDLLPVNGPRVSPVARSSDGPAGVALPLAVSVRAVLIRRFMSARRPRPRLWPAAWKTV